MCLVISYGFLHHILKEMTWFSGGHIAGVHAEEVWRLPDPGLPGHSLPHTLHLHQDLGKGLMLAVVPSIY